MKRPFTTVLLILGAVVVVTIIVIGVFLDSIVKSALENYGPRMTQTSVVVDAVHLSLLTGSAKVRGLVVGNPNGYKTSQAISVGVIAVGVNPLSVFSHKVVLRSIRVESPQITFEGGLSGNNLGQISDNLNSGNAKKSAPATTSPANTNAPVAPKSEEKFELDDLLITGAKVQVAFTGTQQQEIQLPDIHLTNLGTGPDGITAEDLARQVLNALSSATMEAVAATAANFDKNAASLKQAGAQSGKQILTNTLQNLLGK